MQVLRELEVDLSGKKKSVLIGIPNTEDELNAMFIFRFNEYLRRDYIEQSMHSQGKDIDEYDRQNRCVYFVALVDGRIIGTVRLIQDTPLPTEKYFDFVTPKDIASIKPEHRGELSRLIITPLDRQNGLYLPRGLVRFVLLSVIVKHGLDKGIVGGYAFVKDSLRKKLANSNLPIHAINKFEVRYPKQGVLNKYFHQSFDPVTPVYFLTQEIHDYINIRTNKKPFRAGGDAKIFYEESILTKIYRFLKFA